MSLAAALAAAAAANAAPGPTSLRNDAADQEARRRLTGVVPYNGYRWDDDNDNDDNDGDEFLAQQHNQRPSDGILGGDDDEGSAVSIGGFPSDASCRHSDFTLITSNQRHLLASSPPPLYVSSPSAPQPHNGRRQILGTASSAYHVAQHPTPTPPQQHHYDQNHYDQHNLPQQQQSQLHSQPTPRHNTPPETASSDQQQQKQQQHQYFLSNPLQAPTAAPPYYNSDDGAELLQDLLLLPPPPPPALGSLAPSPTVPPLDSSTIGTALVSPLSSPQFGAHKQSSARLAGAQEISLTPSILRTPSAPSTTPAPRKPPSSARSNTSNSHHNHHHHHSNAVTSSTPIRLEHSVHAQALLLGVAFCAMWTPSNLMAPNLTQMATDFHLDPTQRDLYLGSYCALAVGVLSLPISAAIGLSVDWGYHSRPLLLVGTALGGAVAAVGTGLSQRYAQLFVARFVQGGFMAASVPVAFSFLSDMFATEERNAASSGLTAMMGLGILAGQVYAGVTGETRGWRHAFYMSGAVQTLAALLCAALLQEPDRGAKEHALQALLAAGSRYDRRLTLDGFVSALVENPSNALLLWQGFFSSVPWGVIFCFLNDYLSQECGFSVPDATFLVLVFGVGCTLGGILGGYLGGLVGARNPAHLPLFMAASTALGILPFYRLLNDPFANPRGPSGIGWACACGLVASLPAVNVRPCLLNVNPPETRGAALTAANLLVQLGRGLGPSGVTLLMSAARVSRRTAFNATLVVFWLVSALQLVFLARTLPKDQESMERGLALYASQALADARNQRPPPSTPATEAPEDVVVIEDRMTSFDGQAARQTLEYVSEGIRELGHELRLLRCSVCAPEDCSGSSSGTSSPPSSRAASPALVNGGYEDDDYDPPLFRTRQGPSVVAALSQSRGTGWQEPRVAGRRSRLGEEPTESTPLVV